jgi:hypothetical protein
MTGWLRRSIDLPIREDQTWEERWLGPDEGLIWCWERGRQKRDSEPDLAARADKGELMVLCWRGGVEVKLKEDRKPGTLQYLAMWQGLRGEGLDIQLDGERVIVCSGTDQAVVFTAASLPGRK